MIVREGRVTVDVPDRAPDVVEVFYNPDQELNRDITIAVLRAYRASNPETISYLDAMAATGIRGVRAAANGWNVTLNDWKEAAVSYCRSNLERNELDGAVTHRNSNSLMHDSRFDVIDLDPYGSPIPYVDAAFPATREVVCVTATDTAPLCGAHFRSGIRRYSAVPRNTEYHAEMGLRILLSALVRTAGRYDIAATPLVSHSTRHYVRTYLKIIQGASAADELIDELGYLHHCESCLYRESEKNLISERVSTCPNCEGTRILSAGPLWLGPIHDPRFGKATIAEMSDDMGQESKAKVLIERLNDELDQPSHYDHHRLCKLWGRPAESMDDFLGKIHDAGFSTSRTHFGGTTFKTDASVAEMRSLV